MITGMIWYLRTVTITLKWTVPFRIQRSYITDRLTVEVVNTQHTHAAIL